MFSEVYVADFTDDERHSSLGRKVLDQYESICEPGTQDEVDEDSSEDFDDYVLRLELHLEEIRGGVRAHLWIYLMVHFSAFADGEGGEHWKHASSPYKILSEHFIDEQRRVMTCDYSDPPVKTPLDDADIELFASVRKRFRESHEYDDDTAE
jgi:hypothetical protein